MAQRHGPGAGRPGCRPLRQVAQHRERPEGGPAGDGPALHRGQILRLVDDDVPVTLEVLDQPGHLVEQQQVPGGPACRPPRPRRARPQQGALLLRIQDPVGRARQPVTVGQQFRHHLFRPHGRPDGVHVHRHRPCPLDPAHPGGAPRTAAPLGLVLDGPHDPGSHPLPPHGVRRFLVQHVGDDPRQRLPVDPPPAGTVGDGEGVTVIGAHPCVQRPAQYLRRAGVVLEEGGRFVVLAGHRVPGDLLGEGRLPYAGLTEGGQDLRDVGEEGPVRPEDEQAAAPHALRMGVEQIGRPVQADGGLAGAGSTLHAHGEAQVAADEVVLLGLDGGGDVPHRADTGPLDLLGDDPADPVLAPCQVLVLQAGQITGVAPAAGRPAEPSAHVHASRVTGGRLVEGAGNGRPPVDDQGRGGRVLGDPKAPDVVALARVVGLVLTEVQPPEEQRTGRQFPQFLGPAAQPVSQDLGVGAGRGDVLAGDHLLVGTSGCGGERFTAAVVVGAFLVEVALGHGGVGRHSPERSKK